MGSMEPATQPVRIHRKNDAIWNILTFVILLSTLCAALSFLVIFINPQVSINPFPPSVQAMPEIALPAAATVTASPIAFPEKIVEPAVPPAQLPTDPVAEVLPAIPDGPQPAESPDAEPQARDYTFALQGSPTAVASTFIKTETGCSWMGVAGQALDTHGSPITGLLVKITGKLDGNPVDMIAMTGTETLYGDGGFELTLADHPFDSRGELHIQLLDNSLLPLSAPYDLDLTGDCKMNLNLLNFRQVRE